MLRSLGKVPRGIRRNLTAMTALTLAIAGAALLSVGPVREELQNLSGAFPEALDSEAKTVVEVRSGERRATGFAAGEHGYYVTALHVLDGEQSAVLVLQHGETEAGLALGNDKGDVAVLEPGEAGRTAGLETGDSQRLQPGQDVRVWVRRWGRTVEAPATVVQATREELVLRGDFHVGDSGAPVVNEHNQAVGMVTAKMLEKERTVVAAGSGAMRRSLDAAEAGLRQ